MRIVEEKESPTEKKILFLYKDKKIYSENHILSTPNGNRPNQTPRSCKIICPRGPQFSNGPLLSLS